MSRVIVDSQTFTDIQVRDESNIKPLVITEDDQVQQHDSDDEYEDYRRQAQDPAQFLDINK